jgi:hypothetical protein
MQVYDNDVLILEIGSTSSIDAPLSLSAGKHTLTVQANYRGWSSSVSSRITVTANQPPAPTSPPPQPTNPSGSVSLATQIANDMKGKNEGFPHGVPTSWDWANGPAIIMGNNANGWRALNAWGVVYEAAEGNPATNTRVHIRNMVALLLQKSSGKWLVLQNTSKPDGEAYFEDFSGNASKNADIRQESEGISVTAGSGYNFHFWPSDRASINPNDIGGLVVVFEARLIMADAQKPDDRSRARYLSGAGADYYPALTGGWPGGTTYNPGAAIGKEKYVKPEWRSFAMTTLSEQQLKDNPPPITLNSAQP